MSGLPSRTYWGTAIAAEDIAFVGLLGAVDKQEVTCRNKTKGKAKTRFYEPSHRALRRIDEAKDSWKEAKAEGTVDGPSARQIVEACRHISFKDVAYPLPHPCSTPAPLHPNVFSDGSLRHPTSQTWALGGAGVWIPDFDLRNPAPPISIASATSPLRTVLDCESPAPSEGRDAAAHGRKFSDCLPRSARTDRRESDSTVRRPSQLQINC